MPTLPPYRFCARRALAIIAIIIAGQSIVGASTLADYRERVDRARANVETLFQELDDTDPGRAVEILSEIRTSLPPGEKVEWKGSNVQTDNNWLTILVNTFAATDDDLDRRAILNEISERLTSISESVKQLEAAVSASPTKDEAKQQLADILRREEYQKPAENEKSLLQTWIDELINWLARAFPRPSISSGPSSDLGSLQFGIQILIYALVIGLMGFLIYKIAPYIRRSISSRVRNDTRHRVILGEKIENSESSSDLFTEAERLARDGNLRAAIRKGYIALLCDLSDRKLIRLARHKTNRDYLRDVRKNEAVFEAVNSLTRTFERNWYGSRSVDQQDWDEFRGRYLETILNAERAQ
jgi:hypothetical protein